MNSVAPARPSGSTGRSWVPQCLICDRALAESELATSQDVHAACPAQPDVSFLEKVRSAAPVDGWPDGSAPGDLVCPRCAAFVNDIVIYENRLADMTKQLVEMVTNTTQRRTTSSKALRSSASSASEKPRTRRPRKATPKKSKPADSDTALHETADVSETDQQPEVLADPLADLGDSDDADDPTEPAVNVESGEMSGPQASDAPTSAQKDCTWLVTTEPPGRRGRGSRSAPRSSQPQTCPYCQKQLSSSSSLQKHVQLHTNERRFRCTTCDRAFMDRRALSRHEVDHTGVRPFCCSVCGKTLLSSHALRIHQRSHLGIKPAECHVCQKKMSSAQMLREHLRIHTGERPFSCEICGRTFRTERILSSHRRTHTGDRPHVCDVCGRAFSQRTPLTAHLRSHTAEQLAAVRRERIGRTAVRTAQGIFDVRDGSSMRQLVTVGQGTEREGAPQGIGGAPGVPPAPSAAVQTGVSGPSETCLTLTSLVPVCEFGSAGVEGTAGIVVPLPEQTPASTLVVTETL
ncbi:zinc finger protein 628-like isoform X2 [Amphibalanus amphitrite]|uniref:zinc finger protein 628-like isoform X2 n=1 Tax=Amphibalanus amphitrite TaxID=1232801 RepID=UPI001C90812D|nr:zinc finger protein 628-like isoform X2 [Amphibalanus amphitrite]XP_043204046.1 zinc finger protein 628-like isoform X2 [Amphibalanus amphitrite]